jgi:hypothetical protein
LDTKALKPLRVLLDMRFDGNKSFVDQRRNTRIGINLGIQPSACPSHRSGAKIEQHGAVLLFGLRKAGVYIGFPRYWHDVYLGICVFVRWMRISAVSLRVQPELGR